MTSLLDGQSQKWISWDRRHVVTAAARAVVNEVAAQQRDTLSWRLLRAEELEDMTDPYLDPDLALSLWVVQYLDELPAVCVSIRTTLQRWPQRRRVCFVPNELSQHAALLVEAGAQMVASQLPLLLNALPQLLANSRVSTPGRHPFTSGLLLALPWPQLAKSPGDAKTPKSLYINSPSQ